MREISENVYLLEKKYITNWYLVLDKPARQIVKVVS